MISLSKEYNSLYELRIIDSVYTVHSKVHTCISAILNVHVYIHVHVYTYRHRYNVQTPVVLLK